MSRRIKYLTSPMKITPALRSCLTEIPRRGGFYNWLMLFKGEIEAFWNVEDWEKYDVIHVNMSPVDQLILPLIREKIGWNTSTKIVANNDHVSEIWNDFRQHPSYYLNIQKNADMVFGTEPNQTSSLIDGAFCIPHPHWIEFLRNYGKQDATKGNIGVIFHWWFGETFIPAQVLYRLKMSTKQKIYTRVYAWDTSKDVSKTWSRTFFDDYIPPLAFGDYLQQISSNELLYEPCPFHTYGRNSVDAAAIGLPMVGSNRVDSMRRCFPNMSCNPYDTKQTIRIMQRVLQGGDWLDEQLSIAR